MVSDPTFSDFGREKWFEPFPPISHRFVTNNDAALKKTYPQFAGAKADTGCTSLRLGE
jgi:hypothetical protein|tara:strand:- start:699 stop:872 length:174 start_codon:yes stop_codon:yes gene_type:complete